MELIGVENSMKKHTCNTYIVKSNLRSKESGVIQWNQDVHVYGCIWWIHMVANLILLCSLKTYLSFETWKYFCKKTCLFFFFFRRASEYALFSISQTLVHFFFLSFFMNNFCIALCLFWLQQNFWEIATRIWSIYLVDIL